MDGLMFDTERIGYEGWKYAGSQLNIDISDSLIESFRGTGEKRKRKLFAEKFENTAEYDTAFSLRTTYAAEWIEKNGLPVKPGLKKLLNYLKENGFKTALATSSSREKAMAYLKMADVETYFTTSVCGAEVQNAKPAPDIFLAAAKALGLEPQQCLVLEDSRNGLEAAKAAGCKAVVIPDLSPAPSKEEGLWDANVESLEDVIPLLKR